MRALLMHPDRDFDPHESLRDLMYRFRADERQPQLSPHQQALVQDLELDTLTHAMAGEDGFLLAVARRALLSGSSNDVHTIVYRQRVLHDCLKNSAVARQLYRFTVEVIDHTRGRWWDLSGRYPSSVLYYSTELLGFLSGMLRKLRTMAEEQAGQFESEAFTALFVMLRNELSDEYLAEVGSHLKELRFRKGVLLSAQLGEWNESTNLSLLKIPEKKQNWVEKILAKGPPGYTYHLPERDEAGGRILSEMRSRGISRVVIALAESADHVLSFFRMLRTELAFYIGCLNLHNRLTGKGEPVCFPTPVPARERRLRFRGVYDVALSLHTTSRVIGNAGDADGKSLVIITGANQGGKSTFLRSVGLAQVMMQCGMFVGAEAFESEMCPALFTHYKREEDATMKSGKLDEELARISGIADQITPNSILLMNESLAATNEREGSEIAKQIVCAFLEKGVKILYVTHLYEFARGFFDRRLDGALFLRAERLPDGTRTFRLVEGEPLETSFGEDLYRQVFEGEAAEGLVDQQPQH